MGAAGYIFVIAIAIATAFPIVYYMTWTYPADIDFARKFGSRYEMAMDQADFVQMRDGVMKVWSNMNQTWQGDNYINGEGVWQWELVYNSWWGGDQTYVNSMAAQNSYFEGLVPRLNETIVEKAQILSGNRSIAIPYALWEQQTIVAFRNETAAKGGLLWVIRDAWYMRYAPMAAFWPFYFLPIEAIIVLIAILAFLSFASS